MKWKTIKDFEDYEINEEGTIRSKEREIKITKIRKSQVLKPSGGSVILRKDGKSHCKRVELIRLEAFEDQPYEPKNKQHYLNRTNRW